MNENMSFKELFDIIKHRLLLIFIMTAVVTLVTGYINSGWFRPFIRHRPKCSFMKQAVKKFESQRRSAESSLQQYVSNDNEKPGCA